MSQLLINDSSKVATNMIGSDNNVPIYSTRSILQVPTTQLAKMNIDLKFVEFTADVLIFKDVSREFDEFQVNTHLCKLRCWYSSRTSAVNSTNFRSIFIFASCVVGTGNILNE